MRAATNFSVLAAIFFLLSAAASPATAQYTTSILATPGAPGYDYVGQFLTQFPSSIDCTLTNDFLGFQCHTPATGNRSLLLCESGHLCPTPLVDIKCPSGSWCHQGSSQSIKCNSGSPCPEGTYKETFLTPIIAVVLVLFVLGVTYVLGHRYLAKKHAILAANRSVPLTSHAIRVKSAPKSFVDTTQPIVNINIDAAYVTVRDNNAVTKSRASVASESSPPSSPSSPGAAEGPSPSMNRMKTILKNIKGNIRGGRLTAIMGPSGSGKTTFLHTLLNKVSLSQGSITLNHQHTMADAIKMNVVGFVPQQDTMLDMLTVRDLVRHSALMRLDPTLTDQEINAKVNIVLELLGISHIADTVVGNDLERGISGGERKRCSIAMELVADPLILLLDEPTSGIDSAAALQVCSGLRSIARQQKVVCCVIHAPRFEIFSQFEDIVLLGKGGIPIYFGPVKKLRDFFGGMGFVPPPNCNPADFYLDVISEQSFLDDFQALGEAGIRNKALESGKVVHTVKMHISAGLMEGGSTISSEGQFNGGASGQSSMSIPERELSDVDLPTINNAAANGQVSRSAISMDDDDAKQSNFKNHLDVPNASGAIDADPAKPKLIPYTSRTPITPNSHASFVKQVAYLLYRSFLADCRHAKYWCLDSLLQIIPAVALGINTLGKDPYNPPLPLPVANTCISMIGDRCMDDPISKQGFITPTFFYTMIIGVASVLWSVQTFGRHMAVFYRDRLSGMSPTAYFVAKCLYDLVHITRMTLIFMALFYLLSGPVGGFGNWFGVVIMLFWAAAGLAYFISIVMPFNRATTIAVICAVTFSVTSGMLPTMTVVKTWGPLQVFWYLSYNFWGSEAMINLLGSGQDTAGRMDHAIIAAGFDPNRFSVDIAVVFFIGVGWRLLAYVSLMRAKPRTGF